MKRFTETAKWEDPWYRKLPPELKLLWQWLLDRCDNAGIIDPDLELASFQIGYQYPIDSLSKLGDRVQQLEGGKYIIPKFIPFQCGELSKDCKAHKPVFQSLKKHGLIDYPKGIHTLQEKDKDKEQEKDKEERGIGRGRPTLESALTFAATKQGYDPQIVREWFASRNRQDWETGGQNPRPITNWQSDLDAWVIREARGNAPGSQFQRRADSEAKRDAERTGITATQTVKKL